jgi:fermentation-respiration switch protein FrsA (DUF1100 family)
VRALAGVVGLVTALYAFVVALVYLRQERMLYFPTSQIEATPRDIGLDYEDVTFAAADGVRLHGWYVPAPAGRATLLFMHGNAGNISHRLDSIRLFHGMSLDVFIFDYRGYGRSGGRPDERGTYLDARAAWDTLLARGTDPERIVVFGRSLGGAIAATLAAEVDPAVLIVESTFTSAGDLAASLYPWLPARTLLRFHYDTRARLRERSCPLLIVHSEDDELVGYEHALALYADAPEPKQLLTIHGAHASGFLTSGALYRDGVAAFIAKVV